MWKTQKKKKKAFDLFKKIFAPMVRCQEMFKGNSQQICPSMVQHEGQLFWGVQCELNEGRFYGQWCGVLQKINRITLLKYNVLVLCAHWERQFTHISACMNYLFTCIWKKPFWPLILHWQSVWCDVLVDWEWDRL